MKRDDCRDDLFKTLDSPTQALVVVNEIELVRPRCEVPVHAGAEGEGLRKDSGRKHPDFKKIFSRLELPERGEAPWVVVVEQVKTWELCEGDALVKHRIWLATEYFNLVSEIDESLR